MSTLAPQHNHAVSDTVIMIGRAVRLSTRNVEALLMAVFLPVMVLLLFVYVFGGAIDTGTDYLSYVVPGVILLCTGYGSASTAVVVASDMEEGIIDRFRSMDMATSAVLSGHAVASVVRNAFSTTLVFLVAVLMGFRPPAGVFDWVLAMAMLLLYVLAITWASVFVGLLAGNVEAASGYTFFVLFLPYLSSAFVPPQTMPAVLQPIAEHQPVTPVIETVRGLLMGAPVGSSAWVAVGWCVAILVVAFVAASIRFRRFNR